MANRNQEQWLALVQGEHQSPRETNGPKNLPFMTQVSPALTMNIPGAETH